MRNLGLDGKLVRVERGRHTRKQAARIGRRALAGAAACAVLIGLSGCSGSIAGLTVDPGTTPVPSRDPAHATTLQIRYLGAGGVLLKRAEDAVLTAPFFSTRRSCAWLSGRSSRTRPDRAVPRAAGRAAPRGGPAVLVGHAHYDHLMDAVRQAALPSEREDLRQRHDAQYAPRRQDPGPADLVSVEAVAWSAPRRAAGAAGAWHAGGPRALHGAQVRARANLRGHQVLEGTIASRCRRCRSGLGLARRSTLAYLIDFLAADGKTVEFRVHYQDAASTPPLGFPPLFRGTPDERRVDVAILCVPGFNQVKNYPEALIERIKPRSVVLVHWEDFFAPLPDDARELRVVANTDVADFLARLKPGARDARVTMPAPGAWLRYAP
ncbi:MAG: hypothetical protein U1F45_19045 [Burkholderiales bacterium]